MEKKKHPWLRYLGFGILVAVVMLIVWGAQPSEEERRRKRDRRVKKIEKLLKKAREGAVEIIKDGVKKGVEK